MSDLKTARGTRQAGRSRLDASRPPTSPEAWENFGDLAAFADEELLLESRRESILRSRDNRRAANASGAVDRWERVVLVRLLVFGAGVATAVVLAGLCVGDDELVRMGLIGLGGACGLGLYRLRELRGR